jgi:threonine dehydrogenase-like Zn-dependent dehydrogenase
MTTMRHLVIEQPGRLAWRECARPRLRSNVDALVRPLAVGRCDLDVAFVRGVAPIPGGSALGHECIAEVIEVGDGVSSIAPGQRVLVSAQISCGVCDVCRRGHTGRCLSVPFGASFGMGRAGDFGGALADYLRVPFADAMLVPLPANLDPIETISVADMALDAWRAVGPYLQERPGAAVLVAGGSPAVIGLYATAIALAMGAAEVVYVDDDKERRARAEIIGARCASRGDVLGARFDIVVDACGDPAALPQTLSYAAPEAIFTSVTIYLDGPVPLPLREMYFKGITFRTGRPNVRPAMEHVLGLCRAGSFKPDAVPAKVFDFDDAVGAWSSEALRTAVLRRGRETG